MIERGQPTAVLIGSWMALSDGQDSLAIHDITVERCVADVRALQQVLCERCPTWLLIGLGLDDEAAAALARTGQVVLPNLLLGVFSAPDDMRGYQRWARRGCSLYLGDTASPDCVQFALSAIASHEIVVIDRAFCPLASGVEPPRITSRERDVLELVVSGLRTKDIAARLHLSENTIESHLRNLFAKLHVSTRTEAVHEAARMGLI